MTLKTKYFIFYKMVSSDFLEYFKDFTLRKEKYPQLFEEKVQAAFECETKKTRIIYFDLETSPPYQTTHPNPKVDSIIEIGAVEGSEDGSFSKLCNPGHPVFTTAINEITSNDIRNAPQTKCVLKEFLEWSRPGNDYDVTLLIAHNGSYDLRVLRSHIIKYFPNMDLHDIYVADSLHPLKKHSGSSSGKLDDIYRLIFEEPDYVEKHRALQDSIDLKRIVEHICTTKRVSCPHIMSGYTYPLITNTTVPRQYFNIPYHHKEAAKACGAQWDPEKKLWYSSTADSKRLLSANFSCIETPA